MPEREDGAPVGGEAVEISTRTLVHGMVREDATVDAGELYAVANALGMSDQQVRLCVKRLVGEGSFSQEGRGRKALLRVTADAWLSFTPAVEFVRHAFRQDRGLAPWDGSWHLVAFAVPESARAARDSLRETILRLGGAPLQGGLYVSANAWEDLVEARARQLDVADGVTYVVSPHLRVGGESDPHALAASLWPLEEIAERHRRLVAVSRARLARLQGPGDLSRTERLTIEIELASEFTRAMDPDPLLPAELLPRPWPGAEARDVLARCWSHLLRRDDDASPTLLFRLYADVVREVVLP
ncbi:putative repressor in the phenylacetic acid catabolism [Streptosporangium carneum]|uniref:Repressor in the phenylacetic acid catabolism n=1 Tax=Streptosporangium carneum TaxID=47481 RepID=A0A9W6I0U4_9ACTN|nr:putative repressor in the phenylacetic acid catabolism [Streptosporangium carneum]